MQSQNKCCTVICLRARPHVALQCVLIIEKLHSPMCYPYIASSIAGPKLPVWDFRIFTKNQFQMMTKKRKKIRPITLIWPEFYPIWTFWLMLSYLLVSRTLEWILNGVSSRYVFIFTSFSTFTVRLSLVHFLIWFLVYDEWRRNVGNMFGKML